MYAKEFCNVVFLVTGLLENYKSACRLNDYGENSGLSLDMRHILVIDDDKLGIIVGDGLELLGYSVDVANGVKPALGLMETHNYDVVLTDKNMPGLNGSDEGGYDIVEYSRAHMPNAKMIMMTGDLAVDEDKVHQLGISHLIFKPVSIIALKDKIDRLLGC